jgi:hypothetical protein
VPGHPAGARAAGAGPAPERGQLDNVVLGTSRIPPLPGGVKGRFDQEVKAGTDTHCDLFRAQEGLRPNAFASRCHAEGLHGIPGNVLSAPGRSYVL